jgi:hypothetical protein
MVEVYDADLDRPMGSWRKARLGTRSLGLAAPRDISTGLVTGSG